MDEKVEKRDVVVDNIFLYIDALSVCEKFDKLGCFYITIYNEDKLEIGRLYRRNNIHYYISFNKVEVHLYDRNVSPLYEKYDHFRTGGINYYEDYEDYLKQREQITLDLYDLKDRNLRKALTINYETTQEVYDFELFKEIFDECSYYRPDPLVTKS